MNKYLFVIASLFFVNNSLLAKKINGYFITLKNDTENVVFDIPVDWLTDKLDMEGIQWKIKYLDPKNEKQILKPSQAKEIFFSYGEDIRMVSIYTNLKFIGENSIIFLKIIVDGEMKLYNYYSIQSTPGMYNSNTGMTTGGLTYIQETFILQKGNIELFKPSWFSFKKDMIEYLSDCPVLAHKIEDKTYHKDEMKLIVDEYNKDCTVH